MSIGRFWPEPRPATNDTKIFPNQICQSKRNYQTFGKSKTWELYELTPSGKRGSVLNLNSLPRPPKSTATPLQLFPLHTHTGSSKYRSLFENFCIKIGFGLRYANFISLQSTQISRHHCGLSLSQFTRLMREKFANRLIDCIIAFLDSGWLHDFE